MECIFWLSHVQYGCIIWDNWTWLFATEILGSPVGPVAGNIWISRPFCRSHLATRWPLSCSTVKRSKPCDKRKSQESWKRIAKQLTSFTNPRMHLFHIPQCNIQNRNVHISVLNVALWDMEQVHSGICEIGLLCKCYGHCTLMSHISPASWHMGKLKNVVPCAKLCSDHFPGTWSRMKFPTFWIMMEKLHMKWAPGPLNSIH